MPYIQDYGDRTARRSCKCGAKYVIALCNMYFMRPLDLQAHSRERIANSL